MPNPLEDVKKLVERIGFNVTSNPDVSDGDKKHISELVDLTLEKLEEVQNGQAD